MREVFISGTNCITPIGFDVDENIRNIESDIGGIRRFENMMMEQPFYSAIIDTGELNQRFSKITSDENYTKLEKMLIMALWPMIELSNSPISDNTLLILSTTKGNITALEKKTFLMHNCRNSPKL